MILSTIAETGSYWRFEDFHLDPIAIPITAAFGIRWYSLAYIAGIVLGWWYLTRLLKQPGAPMARRHADDLVFYATLGIILGGRIGYVLFYAPDMILQPLRILRLWDGGMSFHGGVIGTSLAIILFARQYGLNWLRIHDFVACVVPIGLFFGRIANFINGELWGKPATVAWAIVFPNTGLDVPRHPSQLYEAGLEGIVLFAILWFAFWRTRARYEPGRLVGLFLIGYGCFRYFVEFFREPDAQYAHHAILGRAGTHMGQLLDLPMIALGLYLFLTAARRRERVVPFAGNVDVA